MVTVYDLQVAVALTFFANKVLILSGKKSGWLVGAFAAVLAIRYFYLIGLYIYTVGEVGLIVLMFYGFFKSEDPRRVVEIAVQAVTVGCMLLLTWFAFSGLITVIELTSALLGLSGAWLLASGSVQKGWACTAIAHGFAAYLGYQKEQPFFADFQIASSIVAGIGALYGNQGTRK